MFPSPGEVAVKIGLQVRRVWGFAGKLPDVPGWGQVHA